MATTRHAENRLGSYKGYTIRKYRGFITDKLIARHPEGDVHSRMLIKGESVDEAVTRLKQDLDEWGEYA